ncbi:MAG: 23S rRNA (uracil(1939)-C(5))-methyltransferase RlmD [Elusimicrobia bacterium]|nr:23S rRNA (uracil(1939)-C(5))-methyltransferase RlmD [Elusimicrobiota bacterium]
MKFYQKPKSPPKKIVAKASTARIIRIYKDGRGITAGERKIFVPYAAMGDLLRLEVSERGTILHGRILEVLEKGQGRISPKCPLYFSPGKRIWCGGCDFQHLNYETQLELKSGMVKSCLSRFNSLRNANVEPVIKSPQIWRYRNKMQAPFGEDGGKILAGFYHPSSHEIVDFNDCPVQPQRPVELARAVKEMAQKNFFPVYDEKKHCGWLRNVLVRTNGAGAMSVTFVVLEEPRFNTAKLVKELTAKFHEIENIYLNIQTEQTSVVLGNRWVKLCGNSLMEEKISGVRLMFYPGSFLQVNAPSAEILYKTAGELLAMGERVSELYDIYCGIGSIGLIAGRKFASVIGIEENKGAVACAWKNAEQNKAKNIKFMAGRAEDIVVKQLKFNRPAAIVLDPPRQGCPSELLSKLGHTSVKKIVYVSCNPSTFARDADILAHKGFSLKKIAPVDLFPQTSHVELAGYFERRK